MRPFSRFPHTARQNHPALAVQCRSMRQFAALLTVWCALAASLAASPALAAPPAIPDEWFFDGANRPAPL